ncbi:MAG TPA: hypothetical protein VG847_06340 [Chitinophagaceae bacterium]|nr:hypothetical protein [Chitinophagaceae bacterium]
MTKRNEFDSFSMGLEAIIILILCIYYLVVSIGKSYNLSIYSTTNFWIIISFLIYLAGTFFLYIMAENMQMDKHFRVLYIIINAVFNILKNVLLSIAMLMKPSSSEERIRPGHVDLDNLFPFNEKNN